MEFVEEVKKVASDVQQSPAQSIVNSSAAQPMDFKARYTRLGSGVLPPAPNRSPELNPHLLDVKLHPYAVLADSFPSASQPFYALATQCIRL
jgi:hypothetical protein